MRTNQEVVVTGRIVIANHQSEFLHLLENVIHREMFRKPRVEIVHNRLQATYVLECFITA